MKKNRKIIAIIILILLVAALIPMLFAFSFSGEINPDKLINNKGIYYLEDSNTPFTGKGCSYYDDGKKHIEVNLLNGIPQGEWSTWTPEGNLLRQFVHDHGQIVKFSTFYENGNKFLLAEYKNNLPHGKNIFWRKNGIKKFDVDFENGEKHGKDLRWYENGQMSLCAEYDHGKKINATYWDKEGHIIKQEGVK